MKRRHVVVGAAAVVSTALAGCADDESDDPNEDLGTPDPDAVPGDGTNGDDPAPEPTPATRAVREYLEAVGEGDSETANARYYDTDPYDEEMLSTPGAEVLALAEWDDVDAIMASVEVPEEEAESIIEELEMDRAEIVDGDPTIDALTYVFAAITSDDEDDRHYIMLTVEVDGEWLVYEQQPLVGL